MNLLTYLEELPPIKLTKLYDSHWTCQAVMRSLPPMAKHYVLRMLLVTNPNPIAQNIVDGWAQPSAKSKHDTALDALQRLQVLKSQTDRSGNTSFTLHATFQENLQSALCMRASTGGGIPKGIQDSAPSAEQLGEYCNKQWEMLLLFLLGESKSVPTAPAYMEQKKLDIPRLLMSGGLIRQEDKAVTQSGYHFLLSDTYHQMWWLLKEYISTEESALGSDLSAVIGFLLQLGFRSGPCAYVDLTPDEQRIAADMAALGVLCPFKGKDGRVYVSPTALACSICAGGGSGAKGVDGYIIVESNYKVYAYTNSQIRIKVLGLFTRMEVILPNLVVGTINRESAMAAFLSGIRAAEIVTYLRQHASPHIANRSPLVPEVVADQIQLWEAEQNRLRYTESCLFDGFKDDEIFTKSAQHAKKCGCWLWQDTKKRRLVTAMSGHEAMKQFIRANK